MPETPVSGVPATRVRVIRDQAPDSRGAYVLYWMTGTRRTSFSFALQHAVHWGQRLGVPVVVFEALRVGYRWASPRHHTFIVQGMADQRRACAEAGVTYLPYVERAAGDGKGLLAALAARAAVVVTDDSPVFFLPKILDAAAAQLDVRLEAIDDYGLLPRRATDRVFTTAHSFRTHLQKELPEHLLHRPLASPLAAAPSTAPDLAAGVLDKWTFATADELDDPARMIAALPIDQAVEAVERRGGAAAGRERLATFVADELATYAEDRNHPDADAGSKLSPYLHYGHVGAYEAFVAVADRFDWTPAQLGEPNRGARHGWWGFDEHVESFLDELVTWREIGGNFATHRDDIDAFDSLPDWAIKTMAQHADDPRDHHYSLEQLDDARTHDELWNAAQRQLRHEGIMHNYLRMLWGKLVYAWSPTPRRALQILIELNNRYALDGRDPNSYSGILWVLGRYDRAWGPERPVFGKLRYMTSNSTRRKLRIGEYLERWGPNAGQGKLF